MKLRICVSIKTNAFIKTIFFNTLINHNNNPQSGSVLIFVKIMRTHHFSPQLVVRPKSPSSRGYVGAVSRLKSRSMSDQINLSRRDTSSRLWNTRHTTRYNRTTKWPVRCLIWYICRAERFWTDKEFEGLTPRRNSFWLSYKMACGFHFSAPHTQTL